MIGYIYLLQEREFISLNKEIYKLGKTKQENLKRLKQYSKGSELIIQLQCENCDIAEKNLIIIFKQKFIQRTDIGTEYFEGDKDKMQEIIYNHIINCKKVIIDCYSSDEEYMDID